MPICLCGMVCANSTMGTPSSLATDTPVIPAGCVSVPRRMSLAWFLPPRITRALSGILEPLISNFYYLVLCHVKVEGYRNREHSSLLQENERQHTIRTRSKYFYPSFYGGQNTSPFPQLNLIGDTGNVTDTIYGVNFSKRLY